MIGRVPRPAAPVPRRALPPAACLLLTATLLLLGGPRTARAGAGDRERAAPPAPVDNASHVDDGDPALLADLAAAEDGLRQGQPAAAADALQRILERRWLDPAAGVLVPHVRATDGTTLYEGAWRVAEAQLIGGEPALRAAYAARYAPSAERLLAEAGARLDEERLADAVRRFAALPAGREAALLLADLCAERGEADLARGWLDRLEGLEELSAEPEAEVAAWRARRLARAARLGAPRGAAAEWPTTGGAPDRVARPPALGTALEPRAQLPLTPPEERAPDLPRGERPAPSPWLPARGVLCNGTLFVCEGASLLALDPRTLEVRDRVGLGLPASGEARAQSLADARESLPLAEGHALSADVRRDGRTRVYVTALQRVEGDYEGGRRPQGSLVAFLWDGTTLMRRWAAGGPQRRAPLLEGVALFGAPCLYRGLVWAAGVRPTEVTSDRVEAWLVGLDPETGHARRQVLLGTGSPVRGERLDEAVPSAPAAARGRLVVSTSLGFVAAVDAEDGRLAWIFRHDRAVERGRLRRLGTKNETQRPRETSFANEPPLLLEGLVVAAPTDSEHVYGLDERPRGRARLLQRWAPVHRRLDLPRIALEQLVGALPASAARPRTIVGVGQGDPESDLPGHLVVGLSADSGRPLWAVTADTGRAAVPCGRALVTEGEVFVPTRHGLKVLDLAQPGREILLRALGADGRPVPAAVPEDGEEGLDEDSWAGNLVPVPGVGVVAVGLHHVALWAR